MMTVLVPFVKVEPAPDVSQLPRTVHVPVVSVIAPDVPLFIVTSTTETDDLLAIRAPEFPTVSEPPVSGRPAGASTIVEPAVSWIVSRLLQRSPFVAIVKVTVPLVAEAPKATL
jgi:hypothetical protein